MLAVFTADFVLPLLNRSPVFLLLHQIGFVNVLILYLLFFVVLLGGHGRWGGVPDARRGAAHVLCAVELVNATGQQHAIAVQHHGALGTGLTGQEKRMEVILSEHGTGAKIDAAAELFRAPSTLKY